MIIGAAFCSSCGSAVNQSSEQFSSVQIADNFLKLFPDTIAYRSEAKSYKWNYEQGLMYEAFYQMWVHTNNKKYFDYLKKNIDYYVENDGNIKTYKLVDFNIDNITPGKTLLRLYADVKEEKYKKAADTLRKQLSLHPRTNEGGFWHKKIYPYQMWLDGLYMAEPFYAKYAQMFDESGSFDDIANQFLYIHKHLKDEKTGLYYHGWDESKSQKWADPNTGRSPNFWGRSNGWFIMALVDVLEIFPQDHPRRNDLLRIFVNLSESLKSFRDAETKLWFQVLDKGNLNGNYIEASASLMFIYSFAKGANKGYLDKEYLKIAKESFESLSGKLVTIDSNGFLYLNNVCSVGGLGGNPYRDGSFEYYISEPKRTNDFKGYGPYILAAIELEKDVK
ncbi:MAG: glycoside hydrolase family 88 protein [Ignavibacteriaceae bacterium]|nr:glycoside hydrolase family 88 protein [Ignavibacteriaceae bacterium]